MKNFAILLLAAGLILLLSIGWFDISNRETTSPTSTKDKEQRPTEQSTAPNISRVPTTCTGVAIKELTEGPYYKSGSPEQQTIRKDDTPTTPLVLEGYVFDTNCRPLAHAWLDFWQADSLGNYDNSGYTLRGHQFTDAAGKYRLETVVPGQYPGRTEHIHFKIKPPGSNRTITSQLFFPAVAANTRDSIFDISLVVAMTDDPDGPGKYATYNFLISD